MTEPTEPPIDAPASAGSFKEPTQTIERVEERLIVGKAVRRTGRVSVRTVTEAFEEGVSAELAATEVRVDRIAVDRLVDDIPQTRVEDGVTIVPVFEEVLVVERRIRLIEELHIRPETASRTVRLPVTVRRQRAVVERLPAGPSAQDPDNARSQQPGVIPMSHTTSGYGATSGQTVTAFFDTRSEAEAAVERVVAAGVSRGSVAIVSGADTTGAAVDARDDDRSFFDKLGDFFMPDEDRHSYAEGLRRGGYLVSVPTDAGNRDAILDILDDEGTVDMNERETTWRSEGWSGTETGYVAPAPVAPLARSGDASTEEGYARTQDAGTYRASDADRDMAALRADRDGTIEVVEENLRVGKRDVSHGRVRVRSYVVEDAVSQDVNLRSERVEVERRAVDRPVSSLDDAFRDRTIELEETAEEAVVSKEARVKEEIDLKRLQENRTQTVSDTVRRTEVEIEDERSGRAATSDKLAVDETLTPEERARRGL